MLCLLAMLVFTPAQSMHICCFTATLPSCDAGSVGVEWKSLNAAQKQLRRDMLPLYGTPRALLKLSPAASLKGHAYGSLFSLQVLMLSLASLTHSFTHSLACPCVHSLALSVVTIVILSRDAGAQVATSCAMFQFAKLSYLFRQQRQS